MVQGNTNRTIVVNFGNEFVTKPSDVPAKSGIYAICRGKQENSKWKISKLLYIGEAADMRVRLTNKHEKLPACCVAARLIGEELMFFSAEISNHDNRELAERALIWEMEPPLNEKVDKPIADDVTITTKSCLGIPHVIYTFCEE